MRATVTVDVEPTYARKILRIAGFDVDNKSDEEICEIAIKRNDCYEDRSKLICEEYHSAFAPFQAKKMYLEITVEKNMVCEITSDDQVAEDTILA